MALARQAPAPGALLPLVRDPVTRRYLVGADPERPITPNFSASVGCGDRAVTVAVMDTGLLADHPWIARTQVHAVDFTGEGPQDLNGHGTLVALRLLIDAPATCLINVKVLGADASGPREQVRAGLEWLAGGHATVANLSLGVWTKGCEGDCDLCSAAEAAAAVGVHLVVAAGNRAGETSCPARLARYREDAPIFVVAAWDRDRQRIADFSGEAGLEGYAGEVYTQQFTPVE